jgi:hypothetical protein
VHIEILGSKKIFDRKYFDYPLHLCILRRGIFRKSSGLALETAAINNFKNKLLDKKY